MGSSTDAAACGFLAVWGQQLNPTLEEAMSTQTTHTTTDLHHEVRGTGPAVLFIPGATGDAGHFTKTAEALADEFTVITYDRRGNSRSTANADGPAVGTMKSQSDDAANLIAACGYDQVVVFGTSGGAIITLDLIARHPEVVRGAVVHEPPLLSVLPPMDGPNPLEAIFARAATDPRAALEAFLADASTPTALDGVDSATRERIMNNGPNFFGREAANFLGYSPDLAGLQASNVPMVLSTSQQGLPFAPPILDWLSSQVSVIDRVTISGHHAPYLDTAETFAAELRPVLRRLASD